MASLSSDNGKKPTGKVPASPCPIDGLILWHGRKCPIKHRRKHPILVWLYSIEFVPFDGAAYIIWSNIAQDEIVAEMELAALYKVGDTIELGPFRRLPIRKRRWSFHEGEMTYALEGNSSERLIWMGQTEIIKRITALEKHP